MSSTLAPLVGQHFAFAHGRLGTLRQHLMTESDLDRALGTHTVRELQQVLIELRLTDGIDQSLRDGDAILTALAAWTREQVLGMTPEDKRTVFDVLWLDGDVPLLAYLGKQRHGLTSDISRMPEPAVSAIAPERLRALILEDQTDSLPQPLLALHDAIAALSAPQPEDIDHLVARAIAVWRVDIARKSGSAAILRYIRHRVDAENIRTALRLAREDRRDAEALLPGGTIPVTALEGPVQTIRTAILQSDLHFALAPVLPTLAESSDALEPALRAVEAEDIREMWFVPLGTEPAFAFAAIVLHQLSMLRSILIGKRNGLSPQDVKKMLPPFVSGAHYIL